VRLITVLTRRSRGEGLYGLLDAPAGQGDEVIVAGAEESGASRDR
jgi:hypothetical protein